MPEKKIGHDRETQRLWPVLALPGTFWLIALFLVPIYAVMAVAFSGNINIFGEPIPAWNPFDWQFDTFQTVRRRSRSRGIYREVWIRTALYSFWALVICIVVGYPVAYYTARLAGRRRGLILALILAPWWINYITRMLAWVNLLQDDGYVNKFLGLFGFAPHAWLNGNSFTVVMALAYGYLPFFIIPLFASLDRIDGRLLEASRDLGVGSVRTFFRVTLPLSRLGLITAIVITALPMAGDYYTNTIVSGSPKTNMVGNQIELFLLQGPQKNLGASLVLLLSLVLLFFMAYYLILTQRASKDDPMTATDTAARRGHRSRRRQKWVPPWRNPWRRPYILATITWLYILWSLLPVLIAVQFSFNDGRSRSTWQGFSTQWYCCTEGSVFEDPSLLLSLKNSLILGVATVLVATPLGVMLAMGLTRWRRGRAAVANGIALVPLVTPEIVVGSALYLVMVNLYQFVPLGRPAMLLGHVTFSVSYVLVIVRSRLLSIGGEYEEAARDLGASSAPGDPDDPGPAPDAVDLRLGHDRVRDVARRLRGQPVPVRRRLEHHRADQALQRGAGVADAGAQRAGHVAPGRLVPGPAPRVRRLRARRRAPEGRRSRTWRTTADPGVGQAISRPPRPCAARLAVDASTRSDCDGRQTVTGCAGGQAVADRAVRDQRLHDRALREPDHHLRGRAEEDGAVDHPRQPVGAGEPGLGQLDALGTDDGSARTGAWPAGACASRVNSPKRTVRMSPRAGQALDVQQVGDAQEVRDELGQRLLVDLLGRAELHDPAAVHHGEPVRHLERLLLVVGDEDERDADLALQRGQLGPQRVPQLRVEGAQRLVEEQHRRLEDQRPRQGHPLLLPA